ncbi:MAG: DEAD/DEAH box helicase family protein, partial [Fibrobacterales bacterium]|nr:DEAD/DEAH box helicase family protein [Fibrobacterales bacterium]
MQPVVGQRWVSTAEPELGIGKVVSADARNVSLRFDRVGETRTFRFANAPLARYALKPGDSANFPSGRAIVKDAGEREGLLWYDTTLGLFRESDVVDAQASGEGSLSARLLDGERCSVEDFELRVQANELRAKIGSDPARGFVGPRIDLYPHQLQIAANACSEARLPRRLLSDEDGLGKTLEAGLIFHRLLRTGRIRRALVVVPQALRHQWMVEMYRRFNVAFTLVDDEYCAQLDATLDRSDDDRDFRRKSGTEALRSDIGEGKVAKNSANPFARSDFQIVDQDWLVVPGRREQLMAVRFDLVIVDEAHTISPAPEHRALYELLKELARKTPGLLLLTATPVQLRLDAHFARLHLLDAARYPDFEKWKEEHERYTEIARALSGLVERMDDPEAPWASTVATLKKRTALRKIAETVPDPENVTCSEALRFLCDSLGTGRAVVRNTRRSVGGFFKRKLVRHELKADPAYRAECASMADEIGLEPEELFWFGQNGAVFFDKRWFEDARQKRVEELWTRDEKIRWLASFLKKRPKEKVLVLCGSEFSALSTQCALRKLGVPDVAIFFEQMGESYL